MIKKLERSRKDNIIAGVLGGFATYCGQDSRLWRLGFIIFLILTGLMPGVLIYAVAWLMLPLAPEFEYEVQNSTHEG